MRILQPLILATYPISFLFSRYTGEADNILLYVVASLLFGIIVLLINYSIFYKINYIDKNVVLMRSVLGASGIIVLFFSFGHVFNELYQELYDYQLNHNKYLSDSDLIVLTQYILSFMWVIIGCTLYIIIFRLKINYLNFICKILLVFSVSLYINPVISIGSYLLSEKEDAANKDAVNSKGESFDKKSCEEKCGRDIYYIILDGYGRQDILKEFYNYDNEPFLSGLESMGFKVVENAVSNYFWTPLSLSSSLNLDYLHNLDVDLSIPDRDSSKIVPFIRNNLVSKKLKSYGYQYVHMDSTWGPTLENPYADIEFFCDAKTLRNDFDRVFIEGTLLRLFNHHISGGLAKCHLENYKWLGEVISKVEGKKFVFAHFLLPHPPYLFDATGNTQKFVTLSDQFGIQTDIWGNRQGYLEQLKFVNNKMLVAVANIIKNSKRPPIIIIQSDHGPHISDTNDIRDNQNYDRGRNSILLAVLTSDEEIDSDVRSPVNIFRFIFSKFFSDPMPYLADHAYKSSFAQPFRLQEVKIDNGPAKE